MELIDSHAHIDFPQFAEDREAMLDRALAAGVTTTPRIGTGPGPRSSMLHCLSPNSTIGFTPPSHTSPRSEGSHAGALDELSKLAKHPKSSLGEIGLDYFYDHSPRDVQHRVFRDQMALAQQAKLPIIIHCRDAWSDA